jgi:nucleotide-binding universal stress UspA family protein
MRALDIGVLPVQSGDELVGVITDRDLTVRGISQGLDPSMAPVREVMTPGVVSCFDDESLEEAASKMAIYRVRRLVVLDRAMCLAGLVSLDDVAAGTDNPALAGQTLVRTSSRPDRAHGFRRILVALDGSRFAERVLPSTESLAQRFGATVTLIQAIPPIAEPALAEGSRDVLSEERPMPLPIVDEMRAHAESYLRSVREALEARGLKVDADCPEGEASEVILRRARQLGADLIAITTHGRTGVDRMMFGSVAEEVQRHAPCPVLLVRVNDGY